MDLSFLRPLYEDSGSGRGADSKHGADSKRGGGYVSVYLDTTPTSQSAAREVELRWRAARDKLAKAGADAATLDAVEGVVTTREHGAGGHAVFARDGRVLLASALPERPWREIARYAPLPHVMPLLAQRPRNVPHVRIGADRAGGQVLAYPAAGVAVSAGTDDGSADPSRTGAASGEASVSGEPSARKHVAGEQWPVHKVSTGGWAEQRLQRSAEEAWEQTAKRIASAAIAAAGQVHAEFVVIGGDVRERSMVADLLPPPLREATAIVDREAPADSEAFDEAARAEAAKRGENESRARLDELRVRMTDSADRRAAEGLAQTLDALQDGLASDVLLTDEPSAEAMAWAGPGLADVAADRERLIERGIGEPVQDRADAALVRAATATGASLFFLPSGEKPPRDEVAALLRAPLSAL